jgi:tetrahydromethanopterin S-methyltransferase subunit G
MEAMTARPNWSDDRIDGLDRKVDEGFRHVDQRFERVDKRFEQIDQRFDRAEGEVREIRREMKAGFDRIDGRLDSLQRTMILSNGGIIAGLLGVIATQV